MTIPKVSAVSTWPAVVALIAATAVWGSTFVVTKQSLAQIAPATFLTWRFGIAAASPGRDTSSQSAGAIV